MTIQDFSWKKADIHDLVAVWNGSGDAATQRRVIKHMVEMLCRINTVPLVPGNPDLTAFNAGRMWVGRQLQNGLTLPVDRLITEAPNDDTRSSSTSTATDRVDTVASVGRSARTRSTR
jgi:hypothetical protein